MSRKLLSTIKSRFGLESKTIQEGAALHSKKHLLSL